MVLIWLFGSVMIESASARGVGVLPAGLLGLGHFNAPCVVSR